MVTHAHDLRPARLGLRPTVLAPQSMLCCRLPMAALQGDAEDYRSAHLCAQELQMITTTTKRCRS